MYTYVSPEPLNIALLFPLHNSWNGEIFRSMMMESNILSALLELYLKHSSKMRTSPFGGITRCQHGGCGVPSRVPSVPVVNHRQKSEPNKVINDSGP